jgi:hypothetical protein
VENKKREGGEWEVSEGDTFDVGVKSTRMRISEDSRHNSNN